MAVIFLAVGLVGGYSTGRPLNDNDRDVLVALVSGGLGLLTGLGVAELSLRHSRALEDRRVAREDTHRFTADKASAYAKLLSAADLARAAVWEAGYGLEAAKQQAASDRVDEASAASDVATLLASSEVNTAISNHHEEMIDFYNAISTTMADLDDAARGIASEKDGAWYKMAKALVRRRSELINAMRSDLGLGYLPDETPGPPEDSKQEG